MSRLNQRIKEFFIPVINEQELREMDRETVKNIRTIAKIAGLVELLSIIAFVAVNRVYDSSAFISIISVGFCAVICFITVLITGSIQKRQIYNHRSIVAFSTFFLILLAAWGALVSFRHYIAGDQIITFYSVMVCVVCFVTYYPVTGAILVAACFGGLYTMLFIHDRAVSVDVYNYVTFSAICVSLIVVRFHRQMETVRKALNLEETNGKLQYVSRHDGLSGLRNRVAYAEDLSSYIGRTITVLLSDINYFKDINDAHGHMIGDAAIVAAGNFIREYFPNANAYRYGGDEFLIITEGTREYMLEYLHGDKPTFSIPVKEGRLIIDISFGTATGTPQNADDMRRLIAQADDELYKIKKEIHKDDED